MSEFQAKVRVLSHQGMGVVDHPDGRVFFVRGTWPGDEAIFSIGGNAKSYESIPVVRFISRSPDVGEVPCPHRGDAAGQCGGCPWMGVTYEAQLQAKTQRIHFLLSKNEIQVSDVRPIIGSPKVFGYRNRAQFKTDGKLVGYMSEGTNTLAPIEDCLVLNDSMRTILKGIKSSSRLAEWVPTQGFSWSYLDVDDHQSLNEVQANRRRPFRQGNTEQNEAMKRWIVASLLGVQKSWPVVEAFCGSGNFTEALSTAGFSNILAAEVRGQAVLELRARDLPGVKILEIDMNDKSVWQQLGKNQPKAKVLVLDPPREGIEKRKGLFENLPQLEVIIYISCEPATWSRDVKDFQQSGWKVAHVTPLDLFPHTPHVELMSLLVKA